MEKKILRTQSKTCEYLRKAAEILKNFTEKLMLNGVTWRNFQLKLEKQKITLKMFLYSQTFFTLWIILVQLKKSSKYFFIVTEFSLIKKYYI